MLRTSSEILAPVREKVEAGERLTLEDGLVLESPDVPLPELGELANLVRERKNGNAGYYNINTHLNATNICVYRCNFCAFRSDLRQAKGYWMSNEQVLARGQEAVDNGCTEMHIVGGLHHRAKYDWYRKVISLLSDNYPSLHLKAWTPVEIDWFARLTKKPIRWVLEDMRDAGLGSLPGGGAEIFHPEIRNQICEHKADSNRWFETHREAHALGLRSNCTMLYGHIEQPFHRIDHLIRLRDLQDESNAAGHDGFQTYIPLAFHPENNKLGEERNIKKPSALVDLRQMAIARLMLDNIDHIKAYWIMLGIETAQISLAYGADDIDGTVRHELIYHDAGATTPEVMSVADIERIIREAGRDPIERDTLYHRVERDEASWRSGEKITAGA
ncbi:MAG: aminofutalosine synthase MqnE [Planctomycetota bacterium]